MAAMLIKLACIVLGCVVVAGPIMMTARADWVPNDYRSAFHYGCKKYVEDGLECSLKYVCCNVLKSWEAYFLNKNYTEDQRVWGCVSMKAGLNDITGYNYSNTAKMVGYCGISIPWIVSRGASCYTKP